MARKRMISPNIWGSLSFSKLSDFAKLVFIGLFSNADDDGKGCADVSMIKSTLFPRDKQRRLTDIENALSEIAQNMSIKFYEIEGDSYYILTAWQKWQTINRPTPSTIPNPPATMGERGHNTQNYNFNDNSLNTHGALTDNSLPNIIEVNIREDNIHTNACAHESSCDFLEYNELLQIVKEECPTVFNRHQAKVDNGNLQIVREVTQILEQLQGQYSYKQLREIFRKANKIFCVKPSYSSCDIKWVLNNIQRVLTEEESKTKSAEQPSTTKGYWDDALDKLGRLD